MEEQKNLVLRFEPSTIEHLGVKMYSHIPPALAELVANSYDACAKSVYINLFNSPDKKIVITDDGSGMSFGEVNNYFLRIGRNRRKENQESLCGRKPTGKKGLGKLALFGLGNVVEIETVKDNIKVTFTLNYNDILSSSNAEYSPKFNVIETAEETGTKITLKEVTDQDDLMIITERGKVIRMSCSGIRTMGRNTQGVRIIRLDSDGAIAAVTRVVNEDEDEAEGI